jgi:hypothetical protein
VPPSRGWSRGLLCCAERQRSTCWPSPKMLLPPSSCSLASLKARLRAALPSSTFSAKMSLPCRGTHQPACRHHVPHIEASQQLVGEVRPPHSANGDCCVFSSPTLNGRGTCSARFLASDTSRIFPLGDAENCSLPSTPCASSAKMSEPIRHCCSFASRPLRHASAPHVQLHYTSQCTPLHGACDVVVM